VTDESTVAVFQDFSYNLVDRGLYRYYVLFDWKDRQRTVSNSEEFLEYRIPPKKSIVSSISNIDVTTRTSNSSVSFDLSASISDEGLDELNRILSEAGVSPIFIEELRRDRSLISNLLLYSVSRKNIRTKEIVTWPLQRPGKFVDNTKTRLKATSGFPRETSLDLQPGNKYLYTAKLLIVNAERFFREAITRLPAATQQSIESGDPNFIRVSSKKFGENFAVKNGVVVGTTALSKELNFRNEAENSYTGIMYSALVTIPGQSGAPRNVSVTRNVGGRAANIISWQSEGDTSNVLSYQVDITVGEENTFPLRSISVNASDDERYEIADELFVHEIVPVRYSVKAIYMDMSRSNDAVSNQVYAGSTMPIKILDEAVRRQSIVRLGTDISQLTPGSEEYNLLNSSVDELSYGDATISNPVDQTIADRNALFSTDRIDLEKSLNPTKR
jgi:hypothetical protein